jgi:hypothetical protein
MEGFIACFEGLEDPRTGNAGRHDLLEILMIALCTVLCGPEGPTMRDRTVACFPQYRGASFQAAAKRSEVRSRHGDWKWLPSGTMRARRRLSRNLPSHGGSATGVCISRSVTPRDRSPFNAGKMGAGRAKAREIRHAHHDFPH